MTFLSASHSNASRASFVTPTMSIYQSHLKDTGDVEFKCARLKRQKIGRYNST